MKKIIFVFALLFSSFAFSASKLTVKLLPGYIQETNVCLIDVLTLVERCSHFNKSPYTLSSDSSIVTDYSSNTVSFSGLNGVYIPSVSRLYHDGISYVSSIVSYAGAYTLDSARSYLVDSTVSKDVVVSIPVSFAPPIVNFICPVFDSNVRGVDYYTYTVKGSDFGSSKGYLFIHGKPTSSGIVSWTDTEIVFKSKLQHPPFGVISKTRGLSNIISADSVCE
jgi:hypothetical protein